MPGIAGYTRYHKACQSAKLHSIANQFLFPGDAPFKFWEYPQLMICLGRSKAEITAQDYHVEKNLQIWTNGTAFTENKQDLAFPESLAKAYAKGILAEYLSQIDGYFTAIIFDQKLEKLLFISDRFGFKGFYYWKDHNDSFAWASSLKAFFELPGFSFNWDKQAMNQFLSQGFFPENKTWFSDVHRLAPATILTFNLKQNRLENTEKYWNWCSNIKFDGNFKEGVDLFAQKLRAAVSKRLCPNTIIGLSGGLDSRALLALSLEHQSVSTFTMGKVNSWDVEIAKSIARKFDINHEVFSLNQQNWWEGKLDQVWHTDGFKNIFHLHLSPHLESLSNFGKIHLNGFLGGVALGGIFAHLDLQTEGDLIFNRQRRFSMAGVEGWGLYTPQRIPFADIGLLEFLYSLPGEWRRDSKIYNATLIKYFPRFFEDTPWQRTGVPISKKQLNQLVLKSRWQNIRLRLGLNPNYTFTDYPNWLKQSEQFDYFKVLLDSKDSLYRDLIDQDLARYLHPPKGIFNNAFEWIEQLGRAVTLEYWLRRCYKMV